MNVPFKSTLLLALLLGNQSLQGQEVKNDVDNESAVRAAGRAYIKAFHEKDAEALAKFWSPDAVYTNRITDEQVMGRSAIADQFATVFSSADKLKLSVEIISIDFISPNVALEEGVATYSIDDSISEEISYSAVYVRRDGEWLLDRVTDTQPPEIKSNYKHLKPLEWMIGSWIDDDETAQVVTDCKWTKNKNFISRSFAVSYGDQINLSGMQFIGWDPATKQIRSWTFDSDGGFSEGTWTHSDNQWIVKKVGILHEGGRAMATNIIDPIDKNSFEFQSIHRTVNGNLLPNVPEVRVIRLR